ncbi:MAG TPA: cation-transporting P-type ATPase, partial [Myxococcota bacterium]|nr:cation-transporting P-type ATPase [Myxococcota bacterium]
MSERTCLSVPKMCCESEARMLSRALGKVEGIEGVDVDILGRKAWVRHAAILSPQQIVEAALPLELGVALVGGEPTRQPALREEAQEQSHGHNDDAPAHAHSHNEAEAEQQGILGFPWTLLAGGALVGLSLLADWYPPAEFAALGAIALGLPPVARKGLTALRRGILDINFLMTVAVVGALAIGEWSEGGAVVFLFAVAEWLEDRAMDRARAAIAAVMKLAPDTATLADGREVPAKAVRVGTRLLIRPGTRIPLDGRVLSGESSVDESALTGESYPATKKPGLLVSAGTVNQSGVLEVETTASAGDSAVARMARMVEEAQAARSPTERWVDQFARIYTPIVCVFALG